MRHTTYYILVATYIIYTKKIHGVDPIDEQVKICFYASKKLRKDLRVLSAQKDTKMSVILRDIVSEYVESEKENIV